MKTKNEKYDALKTKGVAGLKHINNHTADEIDTLYIQYFGPEGTINGGTTPLKPLDGQIPPDEGSQDAEEIKLLKEKAIEEATTIVDEANKEAEKIIESAKKFGFEIVKEAEEKVAGITGEEAKLDDDEEDDTDVEVKPLVFKTSGWCEELEMSFKKGIYHPKSAKEYKVLKKYAVQE